MIISRLRGEIAIGIILVCNAGVVLAATPSCNPSVDYEVAIADVVVRGRVAAITVADPPKMPQGGGKWKCVTIKVEETLRGPPDSSLMFYVPLQTFLGGKPIVDGDDEAVYCLQVGSNFARRDPAYAFVPLTLEESWSPPIRLGASRQRWVFRSDLQALRSPDEILRVVRDRCRGPLISDRAIIVMPKPPNGVYGEGWASLLIVPVDAAMQRLAAQWGASDDDFWRWNALCVLSRLQSSQTAHEVLSIATRKASSGQAAVTREYALNVLQRWGIAIPGDALHLVSKLSRLTLIFSIVLAMTPTLVWYWLMRSSTARARQLLRFTRTRAVVLLVLSIVGTLWLRSYFDGDGLAGGTIELACYRGRFVIVGRSRLDVAYRAPWQFCRAADLWVVRDAIDEEEYYREAGPPWRIVGGMSSWGEENFPIWTSVFGIAVPFWAIALGLVLPPSILVFVSTGRRHRRRNLTAQPRT